ncbi:MAG: zinc-binding dehydrogenase [Rhodopirellula sp.]|nr:zinc-binding dehydrogenase [Rhodopirellula sp.]
MRAILFEAPRKIRLLDDVPAPKPKAGEVLVQCSYIALCGTNMGPYTGDGRWGKIQWPPPPGWLGHENIGTIVESDVADWPVGTHVLAHPEDYNGFAEYIVSKPVGLAKLPSDAPDLAALVVAQPLATVLRALVRTGPVIRQRCAVVGQGPMGLVFTHLLGRMGASQVIGIDRIGWRLEWAKRFGATDTIDASQEDVVESVRRLTDGKMVDFCVEAVGKPDALITSAYLPRRQGRLFVFGVPHHDRQEFPWFHTVGNETEIITSMGPECMEYFQNAVDMIVQGRTDLTAMVTPRMPWEKAAEAFEMYADPTHVKDSLKLTLVV